MNPLRLFRRSETASQHPAAHLTWASSEVSQRVTRTGVFLKKQIWVWPIVAILLLSIVAFAVRRAIETTMKQNLASGLQTLLTIEVAMLDAWFDVQKSNAESIANDVQFRKLVYRLLEVDQNGTSGESALEKLTIHQELQKVLGPRMSSQDYAGYHVIDKTERILSSSHAALIGNAKIAEYAGFLSRAFDGETVVCSPFASVVMMEDEDGRLRSGQPSMYVCAPVRDNDFQVVAALALQVRPDREFTRILQLGQFGDTGETYAFNDAGVLVSNSRFDEELILNGLLPDQEHSRSILNVLIRDPQGDLTKGFRPRRRRAELPLTRMAADAIAGNSNVDVEGYRDYRGVPVVGAWTWLAKYNLGVATEVDVAQAFRPLLILQWAFWTLFALLAISSMAIFVFTVIVASLRREAQKAEIDAKQLGQYRLEQKLGAGAMGVVYKGRHAMLRRPTAIKLLDVDKVTDAAIERFEHEVQITCQLNHPNTIAIYDYGRTPEGVFYYAMEYLDGIDLQTLVEKYGPQVEARVIHILLQICGSLFEAHTRDLVHRDIKPANIMLNRRGGEPDVVKVLDFGLVKALDSQKQAGLTSPQTLVGTPLYMSPEAIQSPLSVDARSDIYAVGAVGYFLLTGEPVFQAASIVELCQKQIDERPVAPSKRLGKAISEELENALLNCLDKTRANRPPTARDLAQRLAKCPTAHRWTFEDGELWWGRHERGDQVNLVEEATTTGSAFDQTIHFEP